MLVAVVDAVVVTTAETLVVQADQVLAVTAPVDIVIHKAAGVHLTTAVKVLRQILAVVVAVVLLVQVLQEVLVS